MRIRERALQRVVAAAQRGDEIRRALGLRDLEAARIVLGEALAAAHDVQRRALLGARLRQHEHAGVELQNQGDELGRLVGPGRPPLEAARDHQVDHEPEVRLEADRDPLAEPAQIDDAQPDGRVDRRVDAA